jgi:3-oxoacyl-[acyl-carrier protein] reductase
MDLQIAGKHALVCASSKGLGKACAMELARAGCRVVINGRSAERVQEAAVEIKNETGADVIQAVGDLNTPEGRASVLGALPHFDILVNNNEGPPPRDFRDLNREAIFKGLDANMVTPIELIQSVLDGMVQRRFGRIVNITSGSVKMPLTNLDLSSGARLGLTGFLAGVARSVAHANVTINFLLPGSFDTHRLQSLQAKRAEQQGVDVETIRSAAMANIPAKRFGDPSEFGHTCAFLCSLHAGYITGQSLLIDGGVFPGVL